MHTVDEEQEDGGEDVHGLAIADGRVAERVCAEHAPQRSEEHTSELQSQR